MAAQQGRAAETLVEEAVERLVDHEEWFLQEVDKGFIDGLMFWKSSAPPSEALDASKESARLTQGSSAGNAVQIDRTQHTDLEDKL